MPGAPEVWLLGSSGWSADAAAQLGLPYAAAHFINPQTTRAAIDHYRENFKPTEELPEPKPMIAVSVICADTEEEAQRLSLQPAPATPPARPGRGSAGRSPRRRRRWRAWPRRGRCRRQDDGEWPRVVVGSVRAGARAAARHGHGAELDELMLVTVVHDHEARRRSYQLLAEAFGLQPANET